MLSPEWSNCIIKTHLKRLIYYDNHGGHYGYCMTSTRVVSVWNDLNWLTLLYIANIKMIKEKFMPLFNTPLWQSNHNLDIPKMPPSESNLESLLLHSNSCMVLLYTALSLEVMNVGWMIQSPDPFTCKSDYHVTSP